MVVWAPGGTSGFVMLFVLYVKQVPHDIYDLGWVEQYLYHTLDMILNSVPIFRQRQRFEKGVSFYLIEALKYITVYHLNVFDCPTVGQILVVLRLLVAGYY